MGLSLMGSFGSLAVTSLGVSRGDEIRFFERVVPDCPSPVIICVFSPVESTLKSLDEV